MHEELLPVWHAFWDMHVSRAVGMDACPIAVSDVRAWFEIHGVAQDEQIEWYELIRALDCKVTEWRDAQRKSK